MNKGFRIKVMRQHLLSIILGSYALLLAFQAQGACTAANPNTSVVEATPTADFTDNGDGTVTHALTGLIWDRCSVGQAWNGTDCTGGGSATASTMTWAGALTAAVTANVGHIPKSSRKTGFSRHNPANSVCK